MEKHTYQIESRINSILFWISVFITISTMIMMVTEFFSRGELPPTRIGNFYLGVLLIYSFHKEALRWLEEKDKKRGQRKGEIFVYAWLILTTIVYLVNFFTKDYYMVDKFGKETKALLEITTIALEAGAVFILARLAKIIFSISYRKRR